MIMYTGLKVWC